MGNSSIVDWFNEFIDKIEKLKSDGVNYALETNDLENLKHYRDYCDWLKTTPLRFAV